MTPMVSAAAVEADRRGLRLALAAARRPVTPSRPRGQPSTAIVGATITGPSISIGSAGFIVHDDTACMVDAAYRFSRFLSIESCGQCPPCKLGSGEITECLQRIETGSGTDQDLEVMGGWLRRVADGSRCYLASEERIVVSSVLRAFPEEFADHIEHHRCPSSRRDPMPKLVDLRDGQAVYDDAFWRKRPDWTYDSE